jgi:hypothetical protein
MAQKGSCGSKRASLLHPGVSPAQVGTRECVEVRVRRAARRVLHHLQQGLQEVSRKVGTELLLLIGWHSISSIAQSNQLASPPALLKARRFLLSGLQVGIHRLMRNRQVPGPAGIDRATIWPLRIKDTTRVFASPSARPTCFTVISSLAGMTVIVGMDTRRGEQSRRDHVPSRGCLSCELR